ncbi:chromosome partitioning protein [Longibacter salinarum]|uniref:Chromosome partitioning protein n=1 Tax=Longibacter salinarum TaxID=1850348 RepID=A0A2A8D149_9BACT|nr:AAA family ATPase [Longibacter salinarum]PEN14610.1 chromosome partitioning protein [Longibacter salinarum]
MQIIPIINNKGGVGKTTTTVNLAAGLAHRGKRVLLIDLDSQGSASLALGVSHDQLQPSVADVLFGKRTFAETVRSTDVDGLDLLTGSLELANADIRLKETRRREWTLHRILDPIRETYDVILIDCAPSTSVLTVNALVAADAFIVPVRPTYLALAGVVGLGEVVKNVREGVGEAAPVLGIVVTQVGGEKDGHPPGVQDEVIDELRTHYGGKVFNTLLHYDPSLEQAPAHSEDIFEFAPKSRAASEYALLIDEVEERIERYGNVYARVNR